MKKSGWSRWFGTGLKLAGGVALAAGLSACGVGTIMGGGSGGQSAAEAAALADSSASQAEINAAAADALPAIATECPPIKVPDGTEAIYSYADRKVGDPHYLKYQAVIDKESRNCVVTNGLITVKMGVVGRVLLGPKGQEGTYNLPLRFVVKRDDMSVFSQKYELPVTLSGTTQTTDFVKVVDNVAIPYVGGENIVIWVGFDPKKG